MAYGHQRLGEDKIMRYTGPKNRLARREGIDLSLKTSGSKSQSNLLKRLNVIPGQHGGGRMKKLTDYGVQLREKQKLKRIYNITEKQMKNYFGKAKKTKGNTAESMIKFLEFRLDNVVYKLGLAPTRGAARQLVGHGHIAVNDKKVTIPSYQVKPNDAVTIKESSAKIPYVALSLSRKDIIIAPWLEREAITGKIVGSPNLETFKDDVNLQLVVEFYSR